MPISIPTKLRGVTAKNEDGRSRSELIDYYLDVDTDLVLVREPENPNDKNAVAAYVEPDASSRYKVGYLSAELAARYASAIDDNSLIITCRVLGITGENQDNRGVNCELEVWTHQEISAEADRLAAEKAQREKDKIKARYHVATWRKVVGLILLFSFLLFWAYSVTRFSDFLIFAAVMFVPAVILLFPWLRWIIDQARKLIEARKVVSN